MLSHSIFCQHVPGKVEKSPCFLTWNHIIQSLWEKYFLKSKLCFFQRIPLPVFSSQLLILYKVKAKIIKVKHQKLYNQKAHNQKFNILIGIRKVKRSQKDVSKYFHKFLFLKRNGFNFKEIPPIVIFFSNEKPCSYLCDIFLKKHKLHSNCTS